MVLLVQGPAQQRQEPLRPTVAVVALLWTVNKLRALLGGPLQRPRLLLLLVRCCCSAAVVLSAQHWVCTTPRKSSK
jgi:hypothetical protein